MNKSLRYIINTNESCPIKSLAFADRPGITGDNKSAISSCGFCVLFRQDNKDAKSFEAYKTRLNGVKNVAHPFS